MTAQKKAGWTLASLVAAVVLVAGAWPQVEPIATWAMKNLGIILGREQVQAVLAASLIGVFVNFGLPHALPASWPQGRTRAVAGWAGFALTFAAAWLLVTTRTGFVYAMLAGSATPTAATAVRWVVYRLKPCAEPESLK